MRRTLSIGLMAIAAAGCGTSIGEQGRLEQACPSMNDSDIRQWQITIEASRQSGFTFFQSLRTIDDICGADTAYCRCLREISAQAYGL